MFSKFVEINKQYNSVTCYWLNMDQSASAAARVNVKAMPIFKLYKDGLEKKEAITTKQLYDMFTEAKRLG